MYERLIACGPLPEKILCQHQSPAGFGTIERALDMKPQVQINQAATIKGRTDEHLAGISL